MTYSPALAVGTAAIEVVLAAWALYGLGRRRILRTTSVVLVLLAAYQIVEVAICARVPDVGSLPRIAFIVVTWLPPAGLLLIAFLSPPSRVFYVTSYVLLAVAVAMVAWIAANRDFVSASVCNVVYAKYANPLTSFRIYAYSYWLGLFGMVVMSAVGIGRSDSLSQRRQLRWVLGGVVGFIVPALIVTQFVAPAQGALPSIMCHFAFVFALCLARTVLIERRAARETAPDRRCP